MSQKKIQPDQLRSRQWFNNPEDLEMTALYLERYLNYGLTRHELQSGKPIIGIAQTGSDFRSFVAARTGHTPTGSSVNFQRQIDRQ